MEDVMEGTATGTETAVVSPPAREVPAPGEQPTLSAPRQHLVDLMTEIGFGRIEGLMVHEGEPVFDPAPTVRRLHVFGKPGNRPPSRPREDCTAQRLAELFGVFDREGTLALDELIVDNGLPVRMTLKDGSGA